MYMPKNAHYIALVVLIVLFVNTGAVYFGQKHAKEAEQAAQEQATSSSTPVTSSSTSEEPKKQTQGSAPQSQNTSTKGYNTYTNAQQGFSIKYPPQVRVVPNFSTFHEIGNNWRLYPSPANQGKGIISFSIFTVDQGSYTNGKQTYPLYYTAEVRVGISPNVKECYTKDASFPNQTVTSVIINGVTFKKFITEEKHGDQYTNAASYRTVRNNSCYVLEQIQSGTKVKNDTMAIATSDGELASYYTTGEKIIKTFVFTK